jgi:hypothetical protein
MTTYFSITFSNNTPQVLFSGYIAVNTANLITGFYDYSLETGTNSWQNVLLPANDAESWPEADNLYPITGPGVNFYSTAIQTVYSFTSNHFNLYIYNNTSGRVQYALYQNGTSSIAVNAIFTEISDPTCFNIGTKILYINSALTEEYIAIENLKVGDTVKCYPNYSRRISLIGTSSMINNPIRPLCCMYKLAKNEDNGILEDLIVTGGHSVLVDDLDDHKDSMLQFYGILNKIEDKYLLLACVSKDFEKLENTETYNYYHLVLESEDNDSHYGIWANGVLTETISKNCFMSSNYTLL